VYRKFQHGRNFPASGLYPGEHGILSDYMFDAGGRAVFDRTFSGSRDRRWWRAHTPLWTAAQLSGINASLHSWSKCEVPFSFGGAERVLPHKCSSYNHEDSKHLQVCKYCTLSHVCFVQIFSTGVSWMIEDMARGRVGLGMAHYRGVADAAGKHGRKSERVADEIVKLDGVLGSIRRHLRSSAPHVNLMLVSPHGVADAGKYIWRQDLSRFVHFPHLQFVVGRGPYSFVKLKQHSDPSECFSKLKAWGAMSVYNGSDLPARMHLSDVSAAITYFPPSLFIAKPIKGRLLVGLPLGGGRQGAAGA